ncbi:MAG: chemotaxis protein CheW, partial [Nitrospinae bacterium]|nr:chemotaxis protein CheW [Nitrospinota bacterium]
NEYSDFESFKEHFLFFLETLNSAIEKIKEGERVNVKGNLSKLKLFLGLFDYIQQEEETTEDFDLEDQEFIDEVLKRVANIEQIVLAMEEGPSVAEDVNTIFREFHTMKSESALLGLMEVSDISHKVESALIPMREEGIHITQDITGVLLEISDQCKFLLSTKSPIDPGRMEQINQLVEKLKGLITQGLSGEQPPPSEAKEVKEDKPSVESTHEEKTDIPAEATVNKELKEVTEVKRESTSLEVKIEKLDNLINLSGEISTIFNLINQNEAIKNLNNTSLMNDLSLLGRMCKDLQGTSTAMRMVSVMPLYHKLNRIVRSVAQESKKKVSFEIKGRDMEVDKNIVDAVSEALIHIIRNSVDHGVETPRERINNDKKETATVVLNITKREDQIVFEVIDDGKGIDKESIKEKVIEKGLSTQEALDKMSDKDIFAFIFMPGFSTAKKVTSVSGRGVGMDVVFKKVEALEGTIEISSTYGEGTQLALSIPSSFTQIEALVVRAGESFFIIPITMVREMLDNNIVERNTINEGNEIIKVRGEVLPLISLNILMDCPYDKESTKTIVVIEHRGKQCAVLFDEVYTTQEVVLKKLEGQVANLEYTSGSGILGNRRIGLLLNVQKVLSKVSKEFKDIANVSQEKSIKRDQDQIEVVNIGTNKVAMIDFFIEWEEDSGKMHKELFAINAFKTLEFVTKRKLTVIPNTPDAFEGMMELRDATLPVLNLGKMIGLGQYKVRNELVIVCEFNKQKVGIIISGVNKVNYVSWDHILPPPKSTSLIQAQYVVGTVLNNDKVTFVLDFERLLAEVLHFYEDLSFSGEIDKSDHKLKILVVEDSLLVRKRFCESLRKANYEVFEAENGKEALDMINHSYEEARLSNHTILDYYDLIITDIEMPLMDGYSLTKSIKEHPEIRILPVILHSSITNKTMIRRSKEVHADGFISKGDTEGLKKFLKENL